MILKSHNDYWNEDKFFKALVKGCQIIEVDVIYLRGEVLCSHSWRPFKCLTYCDLYYYVKRFFMHSEEDIYLYIEIKTSNEKIIDKMIDIINRYSGNYNGCIKILISGNSTFFSNKRRLIAREIYDKTRHMGVMWYSNFKNIIRSKGESIGSIDLYKKSNYKIWNRW